MAFNVQDTIRKLRELADRVKEHLNRMTFDASGNLSVGVSAFTAPVVHAALYGADESTEQTVTLDIGSYRTVEVVAQATAPTTFTVEVSWDNANWFTVYTSSAAESSVRLAFTTAARYVRAKSAPAGTAGTDTVSIVVAAKP